MAKRKATKAARQVKKAIGAASGLFLALLVLLATQFIPNTPTRLAMPQEALSAKVKVHTIDVGQGDAALLEADGIFALIDTGERDAEDKLIGYLKAAGVKTLDYFIVTHAHSDHIGNAVRVINEFNVKQILLPNFTKAPMPTSSNFEKMLDAIDKNNIATQTMESGNSYPIANAEIKILSDGIKGEEQNNLSPFIMFTDGKIKYLCSGDAEMEAEQDLLKAGINIRANVFKAAHHGSKTSNTKELLSAVKPAFVVISCKEDNSYGHPHKQALESFSAIGAQYLITADSGSIIFYADDSGEICAAPEKGGK